jgi:hypothetical protein
MKYKGSCHCGKTAFEVEGELSGALACNCTMCSRKGSLLWFVPRSQFRLLTAEGDAATYTFNKHVIQHRFCATLRHSSVRRRRGPEGQSGGRHQHPLPRRRRPRRRSHPTLRGPVALVRDDDVSQRGNSAPDPGWCRPRRLPRLRPDDAEPRQARALAREGRFDYLLVESTEISEPLPVAEPRLGRRTVLTLPLLPPPQKN